MSLEFVCSGTGHARDRESALFNYVDESPTMRYPAMRILHGWHNLKGDMHAGVGRTQAPPSLSACMGVGAGTANAQQLNLFVDTLFHLRDAVGWRARWAVGGDLRPVAEACAADLMMSFKQRWSAAAGACAARQRPALDTHAHPTARAGRARDNACAAVCAFAHAGSHVLRRVLDAWVAVFGARDPCSLRAANHAYGTITDWGDGIRAQFDIDNVHLSPGAGALAAGAAAVAERPALLQLLQQMGDRLGALTGQLAETGAALRELRAEVRGQGAGIRSNLQGAATAVAAASLAQSGANSAAETAIAASPTRGPCSCSAGVCVYHTCACPGPVV